ncbi:hypothetical protein CBR_g48135 [Chara braunii]|uniref:Myb/SANT-like DNA-binding domain-containing protein n=1 Tax=Chara braunii TaxID=69332 RepID=A0A388M263_CHABU|nr:hypothetical protein CBR_g48135 [Chara braunii]|eukprot:GBG88605.1 hypothetical protein CBR_g48135 [Chara braunii]
MFNVGTGDENGLREQLWRRAMAMAGLFVVFDVQHGQIQLNGFVVSPTPSSHDIGNHDAPPCLSPVTPTSGGQTVSLSHEIGCTTPPPHMGVMDRPEGQPRCSNSGSSSGGAQGVEQEPDSEYIINRLIRDVEGGTFPGSNFGVDAGDRQQRPPPTPPAGASPCEGDNLGRASGSPNPIADKSGTQRIPSPAAKRGGAQTQARGGSSRGSPSPAEKNLERWGEEETAVLCRIRNEVKQLMGDETEAFGRARIKAGFWKMVAQCMNEKGLIRTHDQCKNKFNQVDFYRRLNFKGAARGDGHDATYGGDEDPGGIDGRASQSDGTRSTPFDTTVGKRKRAATNARDSSLGAITGAMRDHTVALTRSDRECMKMRCDATPDVARQQEVQRETMQQDIASRERVVNIMGDRVEKVYMAIADAICSLRGPDRRPRDGASHLNVPD